MTKDQELIIALLCGRKTNDKHGLPKITYLKENDDEELEVRRALADHLRYAHPLDLGLRFIIADLIDPDCDAERRKIRFERRNKGRPTRDAITEEAIARFIASQKRKPIKMARHKFGVSRSDASEIRKRWQQIFRRLHRKHPLKLSDWE